jgi:CheY-like chemotaxis protein
VPRRGVGIEVDRDRMAQVFSNLLTNASKYSSHGSRIWVVGERIGDTARLAVQDEGIGIAQEMTESVFEAFVQGGQSIERAAGGLGLGLAIVRSLVEAHGGRVRAESRGPGHGASFIVELPAVYVPEASASEDRPEALPHASGSKPAARVLIVDDNEDAASTMRAALEHLGHVVEVAHDGPSALVASARFMPSSVLLDIGLPVMDGYEVARRLREDANGRRIRLIAVTGYGQDADRQRALEAGFEEHLVKPVDLRRLDGLLQ